MKEIGNVSEINNIEKWIDVKRGDFHLYIQFDEKGNHLESIGVFEDIVQVVDQKKIF